MAIEMNERTKAQLSWVLGGLLVLLVAGATYGIYRKQRNKKQIEEGDKSTDAVDSAVPSESARKNVVVKNFLGQGPAVVSRKG